ncbi:MAG: hypothetical protein JXI33_07745 [Candidatus Aminicenantes bacterium]|nr:hypothetical protein [Candidatus Aminicenantes bacterium]
MSKNEIKRLIIRSCLLVIFLAVFIGLHAQEYNIYQLRDASGNLVFTEGGDYDLLADGNGNLHILWVEQGYIYYGRVVYNTGSADYRITGKEYTNVNLYLDGVSNLWTQPRVAVRRDGQTVHFVWGETLKHAWRNDQGTWSKETVRSISGVQRCIAPSVLVEDNETVHILYGYYDGSNGYDPTHLIYQRKPLGGSWSGYMEFDVAGYNQGAEWRDPVMTLDALGGIHATWSNYMWSSTSDGGSARYRYAPAGTGLETASTVIVPLAPGVLMNGAGNIFVDSTGKVHRTISSSLVSIDYSTKASGSSGAWTTPSRPSNGLLQTGEDSWAAITVDSLGHVLVAFADGISYTNYTNLYLSVLDQGVWTKSSIPTTAGMDCFRQPSMVAANGMLYLFWRESTGRLALATMPDSAGSLTLTAPNGGENWVRTTAQNITWTSNGVSGTVKLLLYQNLTLIGTIAQDLDVGTGTYSWTVGNLISGSAPAGSNYKVRVQTSDDVLNDDSDGTLTIVSEIETVSAPSSPSGSPFGFTDVSYTYSSSGAVSSLGHSVQYKFDWGDTTDSGWLAVGTTSASHSWSSTGTFSVRAMARCATHTTIESPWSTTLSVVIVVPGSYFNSPANRLILPEVNWASASGGGDWMSEVQVIDGTGGSIVQVYYNSGTSRRGPFTIWTNSGGAGSSIKFSNMLQTIDGLDAGAFTYYGTGGSLEMITQDGSHTIQAAIRTYNGNFSRTFPALADVDTNTAVSGRALIVPNMSNDTGFRSSLVLFNPSSDSVTADVQIIASNGSQVGSTISETVAGYEMAGVSGLRDNTYSNADFWVTVTGGSGRLIVSGQSANNTSNDPAAHIAVQAGPGYVNSPAARLIFPEVNWASASGGGDWISEVHITDLSGGAVVTAYYNIGTERRGPFTLWTNSGAANCSVTFSNVIETIDALDGTAAVYYGTGGALELITQDGSHLIQAALKTYNGNVTRTFPAFQDIEANTAAVGRGLVIPNISNDTQYRPSVALFNPTADSVTVDVRIIGSNGSQIGSTITLTVAGYEMAGVVGLRDSTYSNACVLITVASGSGRVLATGQSANNTSNDPAAHVAVQAY